MVKCGLDRAARSGDFIAEKNRHSRWEEVVKAGVKAGKQS